MAPDFCAGTYPLGQRQTPYLLEKEAVAKCAKGIQKAHFSKGGKMKHTKARAARDTATLHSLMPVPAFEGTLSTTGLSPYQAC